jgi:predicted dehydrogenase
VVAIVGAGFIGGIRSGLGGHRRVASHRRLQLDRARAVAGRWRAAAASSLEAALARIDVVDVCLPTAGTPGCRSTRRTPGSTCSARSDGDDVAECDRMIDAAREQGVTLMVGHVLRFWPDLRLQQLNLEQKAGGAAPSARLPRLVSRPGPYAPWLLDPVQGLGLGEVAVHDLDMVTALLGRPVSLAASGVPDGAGFAHLHVLLRLAGDAVATVEAGWGTPGAEPFNAGYRAFFEHGVVEYDARRRPTLRIARGSGIEEGDSPAVETEGGPWAFDATPYVLEVEEFARCVAKVGPRSWPAGTHARPSSHARLARGGDGGRELELGCRLIRSASRARPAGSPAMAAPVVEHGLRGDDRLRRLLAAERTARVEVAIPVGKVGARDVEPEPPPGRDPDADRAGAGCGTPPPARA